MEWSQSALSEYGVNYPILLGKARAARLYRGSKTLPKSLFLGRRGRVVASHEAMISKGHLEGIVQILLAEPARPRR